MLIQLPSSVDVMLVGQDRLWLKTLVQTDSMQKIWWGKERGEIATMGGSELPKKGRLNAQLL